MDAYMSADEFIDTEVAVAAGWDYVDDYDWGAVFDDLTEAGCVDLYDDGWAWTDKWDDLDESAQIDVLDGEMATHDRGDAGTE